MSSPDGAGYVVYPTMDHDGLVVVFRADTGALHTSFLAGPGSILSGASVANNTLYIGGCMARTGRHNLVVLMCPLSIMCVSQWLACSLWL